MPSVYDIATQVKVWDFRANEDWGTQAEIVEFLNAMGNRWAFQLECSDSGYRHYQGRMSLYKKRRGVELAKLIEAYGCELPNYLQPSATNDRLGQAFYALKVDTRIDGPWTDKEKEQKYVQKRLREADLRGFQLTIAKNHLEPNDRFVNMLICHTGNLGKSFLVAFLASHQKAIQIPMVNDAKELAGIVCCMLMDSKNREPGAILIDMPRAAGKDKLLGLFSAIETIKDGFVWDQRYHYKEWRFEPPAVWVFTNQLPDTRLLSADRWKFWMVDWSNSLVPYVAPPLPDSQDAL